MSLHIMLSDTFDPWFNLATEDWIFREMDPEAALLFLWRNDNTVVIGRHQNPWEECNLQAMDQDGVKLARRQSGGGAVFHDLGNTNFTFLSGKKSYSKERNNRIITRALARYEIAAAPSGRNDILVDGRKVSGSAFKLTSDRGFHHGTLLINAELGRISRYLTPGKTKLASKGIPSVKARVANLADFNPELRHENLCDTIIEEFCREYGKKAKPEHLDHESLNEIPSLQAYYRQMADWNWRFGKTPAFSHRLEARFSWGALDIHLNTKSGRITEAAIFSDCLKPDLIEFLKEWFPGQPYGKAGMEQMLRAVKEALPQAEEEAGDIQTWLARELA